MEKFFKNLLTGKDNVTYDIGRVSWLLGIVAVISLAVYEVMHTNIAVAIKTIPDVAKI